jgi:hypothetical protein
MIIPEGRKKLTDWAVDLIERCRESCGIRANQGRMLRQWRYAGSGDGAEAIMNRLNHHVDRTASYLFSPSELKFSIGFTYQHPKDILQQAEVASRVLTLEFENRDIDLQFAEAVDIALTYGACIPKITYEHAGITCRLLLPWQVGVYREDRNELDQQEAICETNYLTPQDFWRRIAHLPNAEEMMKKAVAYAKKRTTGDDSDEGFIHQVLLAGTAPLVQTQPPFSSGPGGIASTMPAMSATLSPLVARELIEFHELWVLDDELQDYVTIQVAEPDILIAPLFTKKNFFVKEEIPYVIVQPNRTHGNIWGRSEMADILNLQKLLKERLDDWKKLMDLQYDRIYAFIGQSGMNDEMYDQFRQSGWVAMDSGDVKDVTPEVPKEALADIDHILQFMDDVSGFSNIMSGQGEQGVRAGSHANTLLKTASPRMRDRSIMVERQCADLGDKVLKLKAAKDPKAFWTEDQKEFLLDQLPDDWHVTVDSHSSSPVYQQDHKELAAFLMKSQVIDGESLLDMLPVPSRDLLKQRWKEMQKAKAEFMQQHPEMLQKGGKSHHQ